MQQTDHTFPLFADAQKPDARKSGKTRRLLLSDVLKLRFATFQHIGSRLHR